MIAAATVKVPADQRFPNPTLHDRLGAGIVRYRRQGSFVYLRILSEDARVEELKAKLSEIPGVTEVRRSTDGGVVELSIHSLQGGAALMDRIPGVASRLRLTLLPEPSLKTS